jgi:tRNA(fMet)-specific endonuclease VapC
MILLDTDHLTTLTNTRDFAHRALLERLEAAGLEGLSVPVVAAEEQCRGWLAEIARQREADKQVRAYEQLAKLFDFLGNWEIARFDAAAANQFKALRKQLRRMGAQDLKIAAIAIANDALLLSANLRDFNEVPGLRVENWLSCA